MEENLFLIKNKKRNRNKIQSISKFTKKDKHISKSIISQNKKTKLGKNKIFNVIHLSHNKPK